MTANNERCRFVLLALQEGANKSELCREFGISRVTGDKWIDRYRREGLDGLKELSRRPKYCPLETSAEMICEIIRARDGKPTWGGKKLYGRLAKRFPERAIPSPRTIDRILAKCGMVKRRRRSKGKHYSTTGVVKPSGCNEVQTVDFKGWWRTRDGKRCEPLTIRDEFSRFILDITVFEQHCQEAVKERFQDCFRKYGLPLYIRSDNGPPFASVTGLCGLTRLAVWWLKLGIIPNRILPASPHMNGAHERMHRDMCAELQTKPAQTLLEQQDACDIWRHEFNHERGHEALDMKTPAECYSRSNRLYPAHEPEFEYPDTFVLRKVDSAGAISWKSKNLFLSKALVGETIGIRKDDDGLLTVFFTDFCLGRTNTSFCTPLLKTAVGLTLEEDL